MTDASNRVERTLSPEMTRLAAARMAAVQVLYTLAVGPEGVSAARAAKDYLTHTRVGTADEFDLPGAALDPDGDLFQDLVSGAWEAREEIDGLLRECMTNTTWKEERMNPVLRAIFRAALYELVLRRATAVPVVISEYLYIADTFVDEKEVGFVNGVLDLAAQKAGLPLSGAGDRGNG